MSRALTAAERDRITEARERIEELQRNLDKAVRERDEGMFAAYDHRGSVTEIAKLAGVSRQTAHGILGRLERERGR